MAATAAAGAVDPNPHRREEPAVEEAGEEVGGAVSARRPSGQELRSIVFYGSFSRLRGMESPLSDGTGGGGGGSGCGSSSRSLGLTRHPPLCGRLGRGVKGSRCPGSRGGLGGGVGRGGGLEGCCATKEVSHGRTTSDALVWPGPAPTHRRLGRHRRPSPTSRRQRARVGWHRCGHDLALRREPSEGFGNLR